MSAQIFRDNFIVESGCEGLEFQMFSWKVIIWGEKIIIASAIHKPTQILKIPTK